MRIVAVADTHTFQGDLRQIPDGDVFLHAGDLCRGGRLDELRTVAAWLRTLPHRHKIVVAGNHDWCFVREPQAAIEVLGPGIVYLQDSEATIDGVRFWGSPWQPAFNDWAFNLPRGEALARKWALIPTGIDVLVTHGPPHGIGDWSGDSVRRGCEDLLRSRFIYLAVHGIVLRVSPTATLDRNSHARDHTRSPAQRFEDPPCRIFKSDNPKMS